MFTRLWLINISLAGLTIFMGIQTYEEWAQAPQTLQIFPSQNTTREPIKIKNPLEQSAIPAKSAYSIIVKKNLFSPDRKEYVHQRVEEKPRPEMTVKEVRISGKKIVLYGIIINDLFKRALINNPLQKTGEKSQLWVSEGDNVENLLVDKILQDSVVFRDGTDQYKITLYQSKKRRLSVPGKSVNAPQVIATGEKEINKPEKSSEAKIKNEQSSEDKFEIIDTPFGKMKVLKRR